MTDESYTYDTCVEHAHSMLKQLDPFGIPIIHASTFDASVSPDIIGMGSNGHNVDLCHPNSITQTPHMAFRSRDLEQATF